MSAIFDTLLTVANDSTLGPGLATEWTVKDPTTIDLTLRDDVVFHDGEPFGADAVRFSLSMASSTATRTPVSRCPRARASAAR